MKNYLLSIISYIFALKLKRFTDEGSKSHQSCAC